MRGLVYTHIMEHPKLMHKRRTMSRFYNVPVDDSRGETKFNIFFVLDRNPTYAQRKTSRGVRSVNTTMFDLKQKLRAHNRSGGLVVHATDNIYETRDNLQALRIPYNYFTV